MDQPEPPSKRVKLELEEEVEEAGPGEDGATTVTPIREPRLPVATPEIPSTAPPSREREVEVEMGPCSSSSPAAKKPKREKNMYDTSSEEEDEEEVGPPEKGTGPAQLRARINLAQLQEHLRAADDTLKQIKGKNALFVVGRTGVGKSTLIQRISGRSMQRSTYSDCSSGSVEPKQVFEVHGDALEGFDIGHESKSKTKHINHLVMQDEGKEVVYLDSAGFSDSTGIEVDIATSLSIKRVAETCGALRFVVLVSCVSFLEARGAAVRSLVELVKEFVEGFKAHRLCFTFLFTHTDHLLSSAAGSSMGTLRKQLQAQVKELCRYSQNPLTKDILGWLEKCLRNGWWHLVDVFHPMDSNVAELRQRLERFELEVDDLGSEVCPAIGLRSGEKCLDVVHYGLTPESINKLALELRFLSNGVQGLLRGDDFGSLGENMGILDFLHGQMRDIDDVRQAARAIVAKIEGYLKQLLVSIHSTIHRRNLSTADASKALADMGRADALTKLPFRNILVDDDSSLLGRQTVAKVLSDFEEQLDGICDLLAASNLNFSSSNTRTVGKFGIFEPLPQDVREGLEKLAVWSQALRKSDHDLPGPQQLATRGLQLLPAYAEHLLTVLRQETVEEAPLFAASFQRRASALARVLELGEWLPTLPLTVVGFEGAEEAVSGSVVAELREHVDNLAASATQTLEDCIQIFGSLPDRPIKFWEGWNFQEHLSNMDLEVGQFLQIGSTTQRDKAAVEGLANAYQRGLAAIEEQLDQLIHALDQECRRALKQSPANGPLPDALATCICVLRALSKLLSNHPGAPRTRARELCEEVLRRQFAAIDDIISSWAAKLTFLWQEGKKRTHFTSKEIHDQALIVKALEETSWRDCLGSYYPLPLENINMRSLHDFCINLTLAYYNYSVERSARVLGLAEQLLADPFQPDVKTNFVLALNEREQLQTFGKTAINMDFEKLMGRLAELLLSWERGQLKFCFDSPDLAGVLDEDCSFVWEVESVLRVCEALGSRQLSEGLEAVHQEADRRLEWLGVEVIDLMSRPANFEMKLLLLDAMVRWKLGEHPDQQQQPQQSTLAEPLRSLQRVSHKLLGFEDLVRELEVEISRQIKKVREELIAAGKFQEAQLELGNLGAARGLDGYLGGLVGAELEACKQQLEISRLDLDQTMKKNIENCEFQGMKQHFEELFAHAQSEVAQHQTEELWKQLSSRVELEAGHASSNVKNGQQVAVCLKKLENATHELQPLLQKFQTLDIQQLISKLVPEVNACFKEKVAAFEAAIQAGSLPAVASSQRTLVDYLLATKAWLEAPDKAAEALATADRCLAPLPDLVAKFANNLKAKAQERSDIAGLVIVLTDLKALLADPSWDARASGQEHLKLSFTLGAVSAAYNTAVQQLSDHLRALRSECPLASGEPAVLARARCVYKYVISECEKGLEEHISIDFSLKKQLEKAEAEHERRYSTLSAVCCSVEEARESWGPILKTWKGLLGKAQSLYHREAYASDCEHLAKQLRQTIDFAAQALRSGEYRCSGNQCSIVLAMEQMLAAHPSTIEGLVTELMELKLEVRMQLQALLEELSSTLQADDAAKFEQKLFSLYKFVKYLMGPFPHILEDLPPFHSHLANVLSKKIDNLYRSICSADMPTIKKLVETLRKFGHVLSGVYALYIECLHDAKKADEKALQTIKQLRGVHLSGTDLKDKGLFYAVLELQPSATKEDVSRAYRSKSRAFDAESMRRQGLAGNPSSVEEQQFLERAKTVLSKADTRESYQRALNGLFSEDLRRIPKEMQDNLVKQLATSDYKSARDIFVGSKNLGLISTLAKPALNIEDPARQVLRTIKEHFENLSKRASTAWAKRNLKVFNTDLEALEEADKVFGPHSEVWLPEWSRSIQRAVKADIDSEAEGLSQIVYKSPSGGQESLQMLRLAEGLLRLGLVMDELRRFKDHVSTVIEHILEQCQDERGPTFIFALGMLLEQGKVGKKDADGQLCAEDKRIARIVLESFRHFKDILTVIWNQQTSTTQKDLDALLNLVEGSNVDGEGHLSPTNQDRSRLKEGYLAYLSKYDELLLSWKAGDLLCPQLAWDLKARAEECAPRSVSRWTSQFRSALPELLAGLAAYYTISKSGESFSRLSKAGSSRKQLSTTCAVDTNLVLQRPHLIQILTLLRLFGYDGQGHSLDRQLVQIRTGEGKSMILGIGSLLFALLGFRVRCICYSEFLSQRDNKLFEDMFEAFEVGELVTYSSITEFKSDKVNEKGDIRQLTVDLLKGNLTAAPRDLPARTKGRGLVEDILLVDEVDMFFGLDYYGNTYNPVAKIRSHVTLDLITMVWDNRHLSYDELMERVQWCPHYVSLAAMLAGAPTILEYEIDKMIRAAQNFSVRPDFVCDYWGNRVGQKEHDGVNYCIADYDVAFRYLYEAEVNNFSDPSAALWKGVKISISCGRFCYSSIPADCILGVSGTLSALDQNEWKIMRSYNVCKFATMPSVYGVSNFKWWQQQGVEAVATTSTRDDHFCQITEQVKQMVDKKRAVIVIFETSKLLRDYQDSSYYGQVPNANILSEEMSSDAKEFAIRKAATSRQATFTTKFFGRGMDFMCHDDRLLEAGGVHIIHTFFCVDKSEEVQIQGRTARQGKKGSYCMLLCDEDIHKQFGPCGLQQGVVGQLSPSGLYNLLDLHRKKFKSAQYTEIEGKLAKAEEHEATTMRYFDALLRGDAPEATHLLEEHYKIEGS